MSTAARCYVAGDLLCVIERLQHSTSAKPERWRLLAFAAARLDRSALAREAFGKWIGLDRGHRLDRPSTAPTVWRHYAAALLDRHGDQLDLKPRLEPPAVLPPAAVTGVDLPRFEPPPRSARDHNRDFALALGGAISTPLDDGGLALGLELIVALHLSPRWRVAGEAGGVRHPGTVDEGVRGLPGTLMHAAVRGDLLWLRGDLGELGLGLAVGGGQLDWDNGASEAVAVIRPLLRYAWPARQQGGSLGLWVELGHRLLVGGSGLRQLPSVEFGLELRPGASDP